jgi:hypothetical protein
MRSQARKAFTKAVWTRSSARCRSPVSSWAVRTSEAPRVLTYPGTLLARPAPRPAPAAGLTAIDASAARAGCPQRRRASAASGAPRFTNRRCPSQGAARRPPGSSPAAGQSCCAEPARRWRQCSRRYRSLPRTPPASRQDGAERPCVFLLAPGLGRQSDSIPQDDVAGGAARSFAAQNVSLDRPYHSDRRERPPGHRNSALVRHDVVIGCRGILLVRPFGRTGRQPRKRCAQRYSSARCATGAILLMATSAVSVRRVVDDTVRDL